MKINVKRLNRRRVLRCVLSKETVSRSQIARELKMSFPTVLQNIHELQEMGLVRESGQYDSTGGRKAAMLSRVPDAGFTAGIDVTRGHAGFVLVDLAGTILRDQWISMPYADMPEYYEELGAGVRRLVREEGAATEKILGVGVSVPGILNESADRITQSHALGIRDLPCEVIGRRIPWPCRFVNDANAAGMAELRRMDPASTMVYLSLSGSVGGAIFIRGKLYGGLNQRSGEFGHMRLIPGGKRCYCGQYGCLDAYCSSLVLTDPAGCDLESFFEKLKRGDGACEKIWKDYLGNLAVAINNLRMCFDCPVILGGYVGGWMEPWLNDLRLLVDRLDPFEKAGSDIRACRYRHEASAFGAAMLPVDSFLERF